MLTTQDRPAPPVPRRPTRGALVLHPRVAWLAGGGTRPAPADLFRHHRSYFLAGILGFRGLSALPPLAVLGGMYGLAGPIAWLAVAWVVAVTVNFLVIPLLLRRWDLSTRWVIPWLLGDTALAVGLNLFGAWIVPGSVNDPYHDLFFFWYLGTVLLWSAWFGSRGGVAMIVVAVPLQVAMTAVSGGEALLDSLAMVLGRTTWLLVGAYTGSLILWVLRVATDGVRDEGVRVGRKAAQVQVLRDLHDTALQTLEAIGLTAENERLDMQERMDVIRTAARQQAADIRVALTAETDDPSQDPLEEVSTVVAAVQPTLRSAGVTSTWHNRYGGQVVMDADRVRALGRGVREALVNVAKHSRSDTAVVEAVVHPDRVEVSIRDTGCGFVPEQDEGFGIRHSLRARLADAGGGAVVRSSPGSGTWIVLWVPR